MESGVAIEAVVTEQGLVVPPDALDKIGAQPGDRVVVNLLPAVRVTSMLGFGVRPEAKPFTDEALREIRHEMGLGIGEDLTR